MASPVALVGGGRTEAARVGSRERETRDSLRQAIALLQPSKKMPRDALAGSFAVPVGWVTGGSIVLAVTSIQLTEIGAALGVAGAAFIAGGALVFLRGAQDQRGRRRERMATLIGALLVCAAFVLQLYSLAR